jgi:hypothetical protein
LEQASHKTLLGAYAIALWVALIGFVLVLFAPGVLNDGDTYWHIAAGRWMIDNWAVLRIDPFSYTFAGHPWQTHEWLAEVFIALAYVGLGWNGVVLLFAVVFALTIALLGGHLSRRLDGLALIAVLFLTLACTTGSLLCRPHLLALLPLELWVVGLIRAREQNRAPTWKLLPVMALWANLHASFLVGLGLIVPFAIEAVLEKSSSDAARRWGLFALAALIAAMLTPYGFEGLIFPFRLMSMGQLYAISEWQPTDLRGLSPLPIVVGAALFVLLSRGTKIKPLRLLILLLLLYMALAHMRHQILLAVAGALLLADPLAQTLRSMPGSTVLRRGEIALFAFLFALPVVLRLMLPLVRVDGAVTPATALAHVPANIVRTPVLNDYAFGGYLIFNDVRPFIDGRAELYGENFIADYARIVRPDDAALSAALTKNRVRWTILATDNPVVKVMDGKPGWHRVYADMFAVVHVKDGAP